MFGPVSAACEETEVFGLLDLADNDYRVNRLAELDHGGCETER